VGVEKVAHNSKHVFVGELQSSNKLEIHYAVCGNRRATHVLADPGEQHCALLDALHSRIHLELCCRLQAWSMVSVHNHDMPTLTACLRCLAKDMTSFGTVSETMW
jgi:hypothetical protein